MSTQLQIPTPVDGVVDAAAGEAAKVRGIARAARSTDPEWAAECDRGIDVMAARGIEFQAADLVAEGLVTEPGHPNQWGARFVSAAAAGVIEHVTVDGSRRTTAKRSLCRTWRGRTT